MNYMDQMLKKYGRNKSQTKSIETLLEETPKELADILHNEFGEPDKQPKVPDVISFNHLNSLTPTIESCTMKLIEELGELLQIIGKGNQASGELLRLKTGERNPLRLIEEAFDVAQSAVTMIYAISDKWGISVDEQRLLHERKLVEKGYLVIGGRKHE